MGNSTTILDADGKPGQLYLPSFVPNSTLAEWAFLVLARQWQEAVSAVDSNRALPMSADKLALSSLLLEVAWGREFTDAARQQAEANKEALARRSAAWIDQLPWALAASAHPATINQRVNHVENLTSNLDHPNSSIRVWMMKIGWVVRPWLVPTEATPRLLKNLADTLARPDLAAGLAATLAPTEDEFWGLARGFDPPSGFADQYLNRLDQIEKLGVLGIQAPFWQIEAECWKAISDTVLGYRLL
jgi:hypothetical protein